MREVIAVCVVFLLAGCDDTGSLVTGPDIASLVGMAGNIAGVYLYTGYDEEGTEIVTGFLTIAREDSTRISGTWELTAKDSQTPYAYGPQVGSGRLVGALTGERLTISLNPGNVDNNVFLTGTRGRLRMTGKWEYAGFPGVLRHGTFSAVRFPLLGVRHAEGGKP